MKLSLTFLALAVATVQADLTTKWNLAFGEASQDGSVYTLTYTDIGTDMALTNMISSVTAGDCEGTLYAQNNAGTAGGLLTPVDAMTMSFEGSSDNTGVATVTVDIDTKTAVDEGSLWTAVGTEGGGKLEYCVRYGLYASTNEINFSETVVTFTITMVGGFAVPSFEVAEKDKSASAQTAAYTVSAALCDGAVGPFNQGALICVNVLPSSGDVEITDVTDFEWTNAAGIAEGSSLAASTQVAIPNEDGLTEYVDGSDTFSTILYAEFYESGIAVAGSGVATLGFTTVRRLGASGSEKNGRVLQEADVVQEFDIVADIVKSDDSPTALQTAGGATASFVVTIVGLVGAVLLA